MKTAPLLRESLFDMEQSDHIGMLTLRYLTLTVSCFVDCFIAQHNGREGREIEGDEAVGHPAELFRLCLMAFLGGLDKTEERLVFPCAGIPGKEAEIRPAAGVIHGYDTAGLVIKTGIGDPPVFRQKRLQGAVPEHRKLPAQADQVPVQINQALVFMTPGIGTAVIRIGPADLARFIRVIDSRRTGPGHLDSDCLPEDAFVDA